MSLNTVQKKRLVVSYKNLSPELMDELKARYPHGYTDNMIRIEKGPSDFFYAVVLETEEISYLVKVDVKIDSGAEEEDDKDFYDEDGVKDSDEIAEREDSASDDDDE